MAIQELSINIIVGRLDTPEQEERLKRLHNQLQHIAGAWGNISPAPEFKMTKDSSDQVHVRMNERMLRYILVRFGELEDVGLDGVTPDEEPPAWFMAMMGGLPYDHLR